MTDMEVYVKESLALDGGDIEETRTQAEIEAAPLRDKVERLTKALRGLLATVPEDWPERENEEWWRSSWMGRPSKRPMRLWSPRNEEGRQARLR